MRPRLAAGQYRAVFGLHRDHFYRGFVRLQHLANARDRTASADARDDRIHATLRVVPDFFSRGAAMDVGIGGVLELLRNHRMRGRAQDFAGPRKRALHAFGRLGQFDLCAQKS